jgi:transcriptional regulator of aromatic amino acid metabolism
MEKEMYLEDGKRVPETIESLADKRAWLLERVETYENEIVEHAKDAYLAGESARGIAKRAGVSHPTVLKWLRSATVSKRDDTARV